MPFYFSSFNLVGLFIYFYHVQLFKKIVCIRYKAIIVYKQSWCYVEKLCCFIHKMKYVTCYTCILLYDICMLTYVNNVYITEINNYK